METSIFDHGSRWLKADFHLHTRADKEFHYEGAENRFVAEYIKQLKEREISIGVITNHNKFDHNEFKELRKAAKKEDIYIMPGVELSVNDGSNGIHCLITFRYESWIKNETDFTNQFLDSAFEGTSNRENKNTRCEYNLTGLLQKLEEHRKAGRDSFITMAHVEQNSGFLEELRGGRITEIAKDKRFKANVLAFQKMRTHSLIKKLCDWLGGDENIPAFVEGSDCKKISEIGLCGKQKDEKGNEIQKESWLKIGAFNFEAVKYALADKYNRVRPKNQHIQNAYIKSIAFKCDLLNEKVIAFSPELNNLIGIRGSGKSSILEILRYTLGISLGNQASDRDYKNDLIEHVLRSGGKVITTVVDRHGKMYRIEKIYGQREDVYKGDTHIDIPSIDTVFKRPVYFGQKDLSNKHIGFEADLVKKLIGNRLDSVKAKITQESSEIKDVISKLKKIEDLGERKKETTARISDAEYKIKLFEEKGIAKKLEQQSNFDTDIARIENIREEISAFQGDLAKLHSNYELFFTDTKFIAKENKEAFEQAALIFKRLAGEFAKIEVLNNNVISGEKELKELYDGLLAKREALREAFAKVKRAVNLPDLNPDDFLKLNRTIRILRSKLSEIEKLENKKDTLRKSLHGKLSELNELWEREYKILKDEVSRINKYENSLSVSVGHKGRKDEFKEKLQEVFQGSGIRGKTYEDIRDRYKDFIEVYKDLPNLENTLKITRNLAVKFENRFRDKLEALLTFRVEDKLTIQYNGKPLGAHSLGQRATALILFLLAQKETDVLIIDQPEDDLDNQTIYKEVIKQIKALKGEMQFIFATHNANIPVLGDSEKIVSCQYSKSGIETTAGTIDDPDTQKRIISIMEGGEEAFNRRKNIYNIWTTEKR